MPYDKPLIEHPTYNSRDWWAATKQHKLLYQRCPRCGTNAMPPRDACPGPDCLAIKEMEWKEASGRGHIFSFTIVRQPMDPRFQGDVPYVLALIELDERVRLWSNITNLPVEDVRIGQRVEVDWDDSPETVSLPKFKVVEETSPVPVAADE